MPLEDRLRRELHRDATRIEPDVESALRSVEMGVRRRSPALAAALAGAALVVVLLAVRFGAPLLEPPGGQPTPSAYGIPGVYSVTFGDTDPNADVLRLVGRWMLEIDSMGVGSLTAPGTFQPGATVFPGISFAVTGDRVRTDLFITDPCGTVGTYRWQRDADSLTLELVEDGCHLRTVLLSTHQWTVQR